MLDPSDLQWSDHRAYARAMGVDLGEPPAVTITWTLHGRRCSWRGEVSRLERHDEATRTARIVGVVLFVAMLPRFRNHSQSP